MRLDLKNHIIQLETDLHKLEIRSNPKKVDVLLSDRFFEIGTSGKSYTKKDIINRIPNEDFNEIRAFDFELIEITDNVIQLIYKTESKGRKSYRNSVWLKESSTWKMVFHQGTKLE